MSPDEFSLQTPPVETKGDEKKDAHRVFDESESEDKALSSSTRAKKKRESEDGFNNRFKLRNGREVRVFLGYDFYCVIDY